ncbi:MAG: ACP S-malonyltransferase [Oligoflexia bacterium]|nr:ACP S-malonyltransferase [Oligoflexia bacterium]
MSESWAAVFPGQGSQHTGMGKDFFENFNIAKQTYEEASDSLKLDLKRLCFEGSDQDLKLTANTQPALLVTSIAAWRVFTSECEFRPTVTLGHSLGEYSALVASEAMTLNEAIVTVRIRGQAMQDAVPVGTGAMMAVLGLDDASVIKACSDMQNKAATDGGLKNCVLEAANFNSPGQVVVSGHQKALDYMKEHLIASDYGASRAKMIPLSVSAPFHCSLMKPAAERLKSQLEKVQWQKQMKFAVIHNVNAEKNHDGTLAKTLLFEQMTKPVLWTSSVRHTGVNKYLEFGAGRVLAGLIKKTDLTAHTFNIDTVENLKNTMQHLEDGA